MVRPQTQLVIYIFKLANKKLILKISINLRYVITGKSVSEALILESVNPQYDNLFFIDSRLQYQKNTSSEHVVYKNCFECQNKNKNNLFTQLVQNLYFSSTEVVNQICHHIVG